MKSLLEIDPTLNESTFMRRWETLVLSGHGTLIEGRFVKVPPRTFILFNAPSGCSSLYSNGLAHSELLLSDYSSFGEKMMEEIRKPQGLMPSLKDVTPLNTNVYPHLSLPNVDKMAYSPQSKHLTPDQLSRAIFTPGTYISDMLISFSNNADVTTPAILGLYEAPLNPNILKPIQFIPVGAADVARFDMTVFGTSDFGNMLPGVIGQTHDLLTLLAMLPPPPPTKLRLLFITACRGIEYPPELAEYKAPYTRLSRRYSLSLHRKAPNFGALQQMEEIPVLRRVPGLLNRNTLLPTRSNIVFNTAKMNTEGVSQRNRALLHRAITRRRRAGSNSEYRPPGVEGPTLPPDHPLYARYGPWW